MIIIDDNPEWFVGFDPEIECEDWQVEVITTQCWGGPQNAETRQAQTEGIQRSWDGNDARRQAASERMKLARPTMTPARPHKNGMTDAHRANLAKAQIGNTNSKKPHKYPATRKSPSNDQEAYTTRTPGGH